VKSVEQAGLWIRPFLLPELLFCWVLNGKSMMKSGRGERIRTSGLYVPNVALYQAKLHPDAVWEDHLEIAVNRKGRQF
jgi:hypothetical protein